MPKSRARVHSPLDPLQSARAAGLRYLRGAAPGITRKRAGKGFAYLGVDGKPVRDEATLQRIRSLAVPPAWTSVWICPIAHGHLQATGRDARGRKQYRYHPKYRQIRNETKFHRMLAFGTALPSIRRRVALDLSLPGLPKRKVVAAMVRLLDTTFARVGNHEYAKSNHSYGLTTLRNRHVKIEGHRLRFEFPGKSGQQHEIELTDRKLARIVKQCQDIPGYELFQYREEDGSRASIDSSDVNEYLREIAGEDFSAKDFRTWAATALMALALEEIGLETSAGKRKKNIVESVRRVAHRLGNRPATCRNYYIHPAIIGAYEDGSLLEELNRVRANVDDTDPGCLRREELCILAILEKHEARPADDPVRAA